MPRAPKHCGIGGCMALVQPGTRCPTHQHGWARTPRTASSTATSTRRWKEGIKPTILKRDQHMCQIQTPGICIGRATVVDKIIPAAQRPDLAYVEANLRAACAPCNDHKARTTDRTR